MDRIPDVTNDQTQILLQMMSMILQSCRVALDMLVPDERYHFCWHVRSNIRWYRIEPYPSVGE